MSCKFFSINGNSHSELAKYLNENINNNDESLTESQMKYFRSQPFIDSFGDYVDGYKQGFVGEYDEMLNRLNDTMEPLLQYDEESQKYYYLDKNNERVLFPLDKAGLRSVLTYDDINKVTSRLARNYFKSSNIDFNDLDFESGDKLPDLKTFITKDINSKVESLNQSDELDDILSVDIVESLLDYTDELTKEVENFFKRISLKITEDDNTITEDNTSEDTKDVAFNMASFERDSKANVTTNVKLRLSLLEDPNVKDPIWNEPVFMQFDTVYSDLITVLSDIVDLPNEDVWDIYKDNVARIIPMKPYLQDIYNIISDKNFPKDKQNEFIQAFRLHKNNHQISQGFKQKTPKYDENGRVVKDNIGNVVYNDVLNDSGQPIFTYNTIGISDSGGKTTMVIDEWFTDFKTKFVTSENVIKEGSIKELTDLKNGFEKLSNSFNKYKKDRNISEEEKIISNYLTGLSKLGITLSQEAFDNYITDYNKNLESDAMFKKVSEALYRTSLGVDSILKSISKDPKAKIFENPFFKSSYIFKVFAQNEAFFLPDGSDSTIRSGGKQKWIYSYPSYLSTKIKQWKKQPQLLLELLNSSEYNKGSFLLKYLTGEVDEYNSENELEPSERMTLSKQRLDNFDLGIFNQMEIDGNFKATTELAFKDYITDSVNKVLLNDFKRTITQADKTTEYQLKTGLNLTGFDGISIDSNGKSIILISNPTKKTFFNYFASEYNRSIEAMNDVMNSKDGKDLTVHYHYKKGSDPKSMNGNAFNSQYFERLSPNTKSLNAQEKQIHALIYGNGKPILESLIHNENPELTQLIENYIETELLKGIAKTYNNLISAEIITLDEKGNSQLTNLDKDIVSEYKKYNSNNKHDTALAVATNYYLNSVHNAIEYTKMFTGDMAYYKNPVDFKKRIPATYTDGLQLRIEPGQEFFTIATIESVMRKSPFYDELVKYKKLDATPYENINSADAQAWITPQRWKFLIKGLGKWSKVHDEIYRKMTSDKSESYNEKELKIAAQPLKGVYFYRDTTGKPVYLKYSQAVLSKALVAGSDLETMYNKMVDKNNPIDEVITFDGVKVGSIYAEKIHDADGNMLKDFTLTPQKLYNRGWKLQQDLPTKTYKDTDVGSQIQKNIYAGLNYNLDNKVFELDGELVDGQTVADEIVKTILGLTDKGLDNIKKEFGINENYEIKNIKGFYNVLIKDLESKNGSENVINALKAEIALPGIPQAGSKLINIFNSVMKDRLIKIKTNGGSFIQMSNFGLNKSEANERGVMWAPDSEITTSEPKVYIHPETLRETVKPGSVLISGSFIGKYIPNWRQMDTKDLFGYTNEEGVFIEGAIDSKILNNLIGYRIPNQGLASNDALRIAGILPESSGDTIVFYTGITSKNGSDMDIDKAFIMFPSFKYNDGKLQYDNESLENRLIELYKSVLTSVELYPSIMRPIDIEFINNEINSLFDKESLDTLHHFDPFEDIKLRYLFLGGKAGVGIEANALVDISRTGKLYFKDLNIGWGHINDLGETDLNQEKSKPLTQKDLDYYIEVMKPKDKSKFIKEVSEVKIGDSYTAILNGFVDIAKDPVLPKGNWVTSTTNVGNLLLRTGVHPLYVINFMAQPIIKQYIDFQSSIEGLTSEDSGDTIFKFNKSRVINTLNSINPEYGLLYQRSFKNINIDYKVEQLDRQLQAGLRQSTYDEQKKKLIDGQRKAIKAISDKYGDKNKNEVIRILTKAHDEVFSPNDDVVVTNKSLQYFREQITKPSELNGEFQSAVLNEFKELQNLSKKLGENITVSKVDTEGPGKNINSLFAIINLKQSILDKENEEGNIKGFSSKFINSPLGVYYDKLLEISKIVNANPILFPQGQFKVQDMFNEISYDLYKSPATNAEMMSDLEIAYGNYLMSNFFDLNSEQTKELLTEFPKKFKAFKAKNSERYFMLRELDIKEPKNATEIATVGLNNRKKSLTYEKEFVDSWEDLFISNPQLAEEFVNYAYVTSGFKMNTTQFFTYIPHTFFIKKNINSYIQKSTDELQSDFVDLFYRNNLTNNKYVKKLFPSKVKVAALANSEGMGAPISEAFQMEGVSKMTSYYVELGKQNYKLEGYTPKRDSFRNIIGYNPIYVAIKPASIDINGKVIPNYSSYNNSDLYLSNEADVKAFKAYVTEGRDSNVYDKLINQDLSNEVVESTNSAESIWNEYKDRILSKHPNESVEMIEMMIEDMGIDEVMKQLKECY